MLKYSIIIPIYNVEKHLSKCLDSLVNQTYSNLEIILVNDGTKDNSESIVLEYTKKYDNIIYIKKENGGQGSARNLGLTKATGDYISFVDSDDYVEKNMYEVINDTLLKNKYDILIFDCYEISADSKKIVEMFKKMASDNIKNYIISPAGPWNKIYSNKFINNIKFLENYIYEDLAVIPSLANYAKNIGYINKPLYNYIIHENSTMRQSEYNEKLLHIFYVLEHLSNLFIKESNYEKYKEEIEYIYIENLLHGAALRFLKYEEGINSLNKIVDIMKEKYPKYRQNKYFKKESFKYKIMCYLVMKKKYKLLKKLLKI